MAQRRMFSPDIVCSDAFLDMPATGQSLYFQLGMYADDDGFVNPRKIMRMIGSSEDDLKILIAKRFVLPFPSGVLVIKHWRINNLVRKDWYRPTQYLEEKSLLFLKKNGSYTEHETDSLTKHQRIVNIGKVRLGKVSIGKVSIDKDKDKPDGFLSVFLSSFNEKFGTSYQETNGRRKKLASRLKSYSKEQILKATDNLSKSSFHRGGNDRSWRADPDFLIRSDEQIDKWLNVKQIESKNTFMGLEVVKIR